MPFEDDEGLNLRAFMALTGASTDWRKDLANLMRSEVPLDRLLRNRLAEAFENESDEGIRLDLKNQKPTRDRFNGIVARHMWMEIGHWIEVRRESGDTLSAAVEAAAAHFTVSQKKCEQAVTYCTKVSIWVDAALKSEGGQVLGRDMLEKLYHSITVDPLSKKLNAKLLAQLNLSH